WGSYLDTTSTWRAIGLAGLMAILLAGAFTVRPDDSQLALTRLLNPLSAHAWPRRDQSEFKDLPAIVGIGSELQLEVIDRTPPLPADVVIQLREADGTERTSVLSIATKQLEDVAVGNLPQVERAVEVRAI